MIVIGLSILFVIAVCLIAILNILRKIGYTLAAFVAIYAAGDKAVGLDFVEELRDMLQGLKK